MPRSVLERVSRRQVRRQQKRKRIGHGKWLKRCQSKRQQKRKCILGTWNTRQLGARTGHIDQDQKLDMLADVWEMRKWELVALTDTKLGSNASLETQSTSQPQWTVISRGRVAIALNAQWAQAWKHTHIPVYTDGQGDQCRSMLVQIPCFQNLGISLLATYAPSTNVSQETLQEYFDGLDNVLHKAKYLLLVAGDFNAEVGIRDHNTPTLGPHGPSKRNARGQMLINFCHTNGLAVANTWTPQTNKTTWKHPRFGTQHLLDYFVCAQKHLGNVHRVLTLHPQLGQETLHRDWTPYTDHSPVEIQIKLAPPRGYQTPRPLPPRPATYKGRGASQAAITLKQEYHAP